MPTISHLTDGRRVDLIDSLRDKAESAESAAKALGNDNDAAEGFWLDRARYAELADMVEVGESLFTDEQIDTMREALQASVENCTELGLVVAAQNYQAALDAL